jgi:hypothetical protein
MTVTALHPGRTRALVQRPRRKAHIATIAVGDSHWTAICGRTIPADGAAFWRDDAADHGDQHAGDLCSDCSWIAQLIGYVLDQQAATTRQAAVR